MKETTMTFLFNMYAALISLPHRVDWRNERGDVPGWVLVTLMTAGLVTVLWAVAGEALVNLFQEAISNVNGPGHP